MNGTQDGTARPWRVLVPDGTSTVRVQRGGAARRSAVRELDRLPSGSPVTLVTDGPLSRGRLRGTAQRAGVMIEHEYLVLPGLENGRFVVEDDPDTVALLWRTLAGPPPRGTVGTAAFTGLSAIGRRWLPWWALGSVAARVAVGQRR